MKNGDNKSESRDDRFLGQFLFVSTQAPAAPKRDESFEEPAAVGKVTQHSMDYWVIDSGTTYSMTPRADQLTELEPSPVKHVTSALGQQAEVKGMGNAMFKGADGKMVGLKNVLWVPKLAANLISVRRFQKAGMDTSSKGAKTYTVRLGERILWDLHEDRDVYNKMWQIPVVTMPKERQVAASISTKGTSKLGEHEKSGAEAQKKHKGEENPKEAEEEEEEVQQVSERAPTLPSRTTSAPRIRVTPQQRQGLHVPVAEEEGRGKRRIQATNRLTTLKEALESSDAEEWKKAMEIELKSIEENGTWELVELLEGRKAITSKWLFNIKSDADGKVERYKSRLVAKGYQQKEKVDYNELFVPVVMPTTLRTVLAGATIKGWVVKQMDVTTAFLNGILEEEIFMAQPEGFDDGSGGVWKLKKALYGLKQAPRQW
ncbi:unnamed protein product [Closterium sp. NIES-54]